MFNGLYEFQSVGWSVSQPSAENSGLKSEQPTGSVLGCTKGALGSY